MVDRLLSVWGVVLGVLGLVILGVLLAAFGEQARKPV